MFFIIICVNFIEGDNMKDLKVIDMRFDMGDSAFLIDTGKTAILYDSGFAFTGEKVAEKIKDYLKERPLDYIFLTHSHYDHALGSVYALKHWPNAKVVAGEYATKIFSKPTAKAVMRDLDKKYAIKCGYGEYEDLIDNLKVDIPVCDGDTIKAGELEFIALNLPGHTKCSVGYYCPELKLFLSCESVGVYGGENIVMPSYLVGYQMALDSISRAEQLDIENMLIPHYGLISNIDAKNFLKNSKLGAIETANQIVEIIKNGGSREDAIEFFKDKYFKGYVKEVYPPDAMNLNTGITVDLLTRELIDN